jgi:hypothetical protein
MSESVLEAPSAPLVDELFTPELLTKLIKQPARYRKRLLRELARREWQHCADDIFYWLDARRHPTLGPYVYTLDPKPLYECLLCKDKATHFFDKRYDHLKLRHNIIATNEGEARGFYIELPTTRPFPTHLLDAYMRPLIESWLKQKFFCIAKSRDMFATWLIVTLYTWDTLYHKGRQNIFQSEDGSKTLELVQRANFIFKHQPKMLQNIHPAQFGAGSSKAGHLRVPSINSELLGFPQGPDQIRQYHPSGTFLDEAAFQQQAGDSFAAIKPAIQQGGRFTAISSANPGWFQLVVQDRDQEMTG